MNEDKKYNGFYFPVEVESNPELILVEKILLSKIITLKKCFLTNETIASQMLISKRYASNIVSSLIKKGYIKNIALENDRRVLVPTHKNAPVVKKVKKIMEELEVPEIENEEDFLSQEDRTTVLPPLEPQFHPPRTTVLPPTNHSSTIINKINNKGINNIKNNMGTEILPPLNHSSTNESSMEAKASETSNSEIKKPVTILEKAKFYGIPTERDGVRLTNRELQIEVDYFEVAEKLEKQKQVAKPTQEIEITSTIPEKSQIIETENTQSEEKSILSPKNGVLTASTAKNTNTPIQTENNAQIAKKQAKKYENTSKAYYETIKALKIPVRNHNNLRGYIKRLEDELGEEVALKYLDFMMNIYPNVKDDGFKPTISESLDIYAKRESISNWVKRQSKKKPNVI